MFEYGGIAYRHATDPAGTWSEEQALFGARSDIPLPFGYPVDHYLNDLDSSLKDFLIYTEPGTLVVDVVLYLCLVGYADANTENAKKVLLSSSDHGVSWGYNGMLTDSDDAASLGASLLTAPSIVRVGERFFLLVSPFNENKFHDGTYIFEFKDITQASLHRDTNGNLPVYKYRAPPLEPASAASRPGEGIMRIQGGAMGYVNLSQGVKATIYIYTNTSGNVRTRIFTIRGQLSSTIETDTADGQKSIEWDGKNSNGEIVASGIYFEYLSLTFVYDRYITI